MQILDHIEEDVCRKIYSDLPNELNNSAENSCLKSNVLSKKTNMVSRNTALNTATSFDRLVLYASFVDNRDYVDSYMYHEMSHLSSVCYVEFCAAIVLSCFDI